MGSFNVSCGVSKLSIGYGAKCALIPLVRNKFIFPETEKLNSGYGSAHCFYPFSLPIHGTYDDYGRIENIERNKTVSILEEFFEIKIEQIAGILTCNRGVEDYYSVIYEVFGIKNETVSNHYNFNKQFLLDIGFTEIEVPITKNGVTVNKSAFRFKNHEAYIRVVFKTHKYLDRKSEKRIYYKIYNKNKLQKMAAGYDTQLFLKDYHEVTDYHLCYPEDQQEKVKLLETLSCMFVHEEVYQYLSEFEIGEAGRKAVWETDAKVDSHTLTSLGFEYIAKDESIDRYCKIYKHPLVDTYFVGTDGTWSRIYKTKNKAQVKDDFYCPEAFMQIWAKLTGQELVIPVSLKGTSTYNVKFDIYRNALAKFKNLAMRDEGYWECKDFLSFNTFEFIPRFENKFVQLYNDSIMDGSIKEDFVSFANFINNLTMINEYLFPSGYAGQFGNNWGQKILAQKIEEIVTQEEEKDDES